MPPIRRSSLGRRAIISQNIRDNQKQEEHAEKNEWRRADIAQVRAAQSPPQIRAFFISFDNFSPLLEKRQSLGKMSTQKY